MIIIKRMMIVLICAISFNALAIDFTSAEYKKFEDEYLRIIEREYPISEKRYPALIVCANKGNYNCAYQVGYHNYVHLKKYNDAFKYFEIAAKHDHYMANVFLSEMYAEGEGTLQDYDQAIYHAKNSIFNTQGRHMLNKLYSQHDYEQTIYYVRNSNANVQDRSTAYDIFVFYSKKPYSRENMIHAYAWLKIYQALGGSTVQYGDGTTEALTMNFIIKKRDDLSITEIAKADQLSREICSKITGCNK